MAVRFTVTAVLPATTKDIYEAWLNSRKHSAMTGGAAKVSARVGGKFTAWDGYITGTNLELAPNQRIVQAWRTSEFASDDPDSRLEIILTPTSRGTRVTIKHSNLPDGGAKYKQGWVDSYLVPMKDYFER